MGGTTVILIIVPKIRFFCSSGFLFIKEFCYESKSNIYYAKKQGLKGVTTETGAGQWGNVVFSSLVILSVLCNIDACDIDTFDQTENCDAQVLQSDFSQYSTYLLDMFT